eukprot:9645169-Alexandrium_andersonii.AAC.1
MLLEAAQSCPKLPMLIRVARSFFPDIRARASWFRNWPAPETAPPLIASRELLRFCTCRPWLLARVGRTVPP